MTMDPDDLERRVARNLASLPAPRAPQSLRPRVMAAIVPPVVGHPWFTWPGPLQAVVAVLVVGFAAGLAWEWTAIRAAMSSVVPEPVQAGASQLSGLAETGTAVVRLLQFTWNGVLAPMAKLVLLMTVTLCTACAVCLAAFSRVALGGASQS